MEDINEDQLWERVEQGVCTIVQIIAKCINCLMNEQEKRVLEIIETIFIEWIVSNHFAPARFSPLSATTEAVT